MRRDEAFMVDAGVQVDVELTAGTLVVRAATPNRVAVSIDASSADSFEVSCVGNLVAVREGHRRRSAHVVVDVPEGTDLIVRATSADIELRGRLGALRVRSTSSNVTADEVGRLEVNLASGDVRVRVVGGDATVTSTSGDARIGRIDGRLGASLLSGDLDVDQLGGDLDADSASGDVAIRCCTGSSLTARSQSGDLRVGLPTGIRVEPELSSLSGRVVLPRAAERVTTPVADRRVVRLRMRTTSGDITVERAP